MPKLHADRAQLVAVACLLAAVVPLLASPARADFAPPPESPYEPDSPYRPEPRYREGPDTHYDEHADSWSRADHTRSTVRFHVGPTVLLRPASPGLFTAVDFGERAVGARVSASWLRAESDVGLSAYTAELWIDFRHRYALHPILGAGASYLRGGALGEDDSAGAGVLRGALEYELPIADADARLGVNVLLLVPAIGIERTRPWASAALTVGVGF